MQSWSLSKFYATIAVFLGAAAGLIFLRSLALADLNALFLLALPLGVGVLLLFAIESKAVLVLLLLTRSLLDPLLEATKVSVGGQDIGLGALINLSVILFAAVLLVRYRREARNIPLARWWLPFLAVSALSILYSPAAGRAVKLYFDLVSYAAMSLIAYLLVWNGKDERFWTKVLIASTFPPVLVAHVDLARGGSQFADVGARIQGSFSHPNILAFYLLFVLALLFYAPRAGFLKLTRMSKTLLILYGLDVVAMLLATKTRNAWLACWIFFLVYGIVKSRKYVLVCLILPPLLLFSPSVSGRLLDLSYGTGTDVESDLNSFAWRVELWRSSLPSMLQRPLIGHGLSSFQPLSVNFFPADDDGVPAHNVYVEILFEAGLLGLISFLYLFGKLLGFLIKRMRETGPPVSAGYAVAFAYLCSYLFSCAGDNMQDYLAFNWYLWFWVGLLVKSGLLHARKNIGDHSVV